MRKTIPFFAATALALAMIVPPASAAASRDGRWVGTNSQGEPFKFTVRHEEIVALLTHLNFGACNLHVTERGSGLSIPIRADGTFRVELTSAEDRHDTLTISGEFTAPRRAIGTVRAVEKGGDCDGTTKATWKVTKR